MTVYRMLTLSLLAVSTLGAVPAASAASADELPFQYHWYRTEIIIFERPAVSPWNASETLLVDDARAYPAEIVAFAASDDERLALHNLAPETRAMLPYPTYDPAMLEALGRLPDPFGAETDAETDAGLSPSEEEVAPEGPLSDAVELDASAAAEPMPATPERPARELLRESLNEAIAAFEHDLLLRSYHALPDKSLVLRREARSMGRTGRYRVILHRAWVQPIPERGQGVPVLLQAGERYGDRWLIEGTLALTLGRYLHVDVNLWRQAPPPPPPIAPRVEVREPQDPLSQDATLDAPVVDAAPEAIDTLPPAGTPLLDGYMVLSEQRRLRSEELHYLDHPKFGVLVRIDPVPPSEAITLLASDLETLEKNR